MRARFTVQNAYVLHSHLDAVATAGEAMRTAHLSFEAYPTGHTDLLTKLRHIAQFAQRMQAYELALLLKVRKARQWCANIGPREKGLSPVIPLFIASTALVDDIYAEAAKIGEHSFAGEIDTLNFLTTRGFLLPGVTALDAIEELGPCDTIRLLGEIPLSPLTETCRTFADVIDLHFALYRNVAAEEPVDDSDALVPVVMAAPSVTAEDAGVGDEADEEFILVGDDEVPNTACEHENVANSDPDHSEAVDADDVDVDEALEGLEDETVMAEDVPAPARPVPASRPTLRERLASIET